MTKKIAILLTAVLVITSCFAACTSKTADSNEEQTATDGLNAGSEEFGFEEDEDGNTVPVIYENGKAYIVDENGKKTKKKIKNPKNAPDTTASTSANKDSNKDVTTTGKPDIPTNKTDQAPETTDSKLTTIKSKDDKVPSTSDSGVPVKFSNEDISTIAYMLEVPYLYSESYENSQKVPISVANHVACWMAQKNGANNSTFAKGDVVLNLFRYFAQTVINYKDLCNSDTSKNRAPITYNSSNDTFSIIAKESNAIEMQTHSITVESIESLGNNNYYKVTASVDEKNSSGCKYKKVVAVMQKNLLDSSLGFSVKALKWS